MRPFCSSWGRNFQKIVVIGSVGLVWVILSEALGLHGHLCFGLPFLHSIFFPFWGYRGKWPGTLVSCETKCRCSRKLTFPLLSRTKAFKNIYQSSEECIIHITITVVVAKMMLRVENGKDSGDSASCCFKTSHIIVCRSSNTDES